MPRPSPAITQFVAATLALTCVAPAFADELTPARDWPQFRGPAATGLADGKPLPKEWSVAENKNVAWKVEIPGLSHSSPVIWGDKLFVTTAIPTTGKKELKVGLYGAGDSADDMVEHEYQVICLDKNTGKKIWDRTATKTKPRFKRHTKATHANSTPVTNGNVVVACFGSEGLFCFDLNGEMKWQKDLGALDVGPHNGPQLEWGFASSPVIIAGRVVVQADVKENSYLAAFDANDGREIWRVARSDVPGWTSPTGLRTADGWQVLVNGCRHIGAYTLADGKEIWRMSGGGGIPVPTPVVSGDMIYLTSNHRPLRDGDPLKPIFVIRTDAKGEIETPSEDASSRYVAWMHEQRGNYMQTPLVYRKIAYFCNDNGMLNAFDAESGDPLYRQRLGEKSSGFTASGVAGDGKVYFTSEDGDVYVVDADSRELKILATNAIGEICMATPAISDGRIYWRTRDHVICISARR